MFASSGDISLPDDLFSASCPRLSSSPEDMLSDLLRSLPRMYPDAKCIAIIKATTINGARMVRCSDVGAGDGEDVMTPVRVDEASNEETAVVVISVRKVLFDARGVLVDVGVISVRKVLVDVRGVPVDVRVISVRKVFVGVLGVSVDGGVISVRKVLVDCVGVSVDDPSQTVQLEPGLSTPTHTETCT